MIKPPPRAAGRRQRGRATITTITTISINNSNAPIYTVQGELAMKEISYKVLYLYLSLSLSIYIYIYTYIYIYIYIEREREGPACLYIDVYTSRMYIHVYISTCSRRSRCLAGHLLCCCNIRQVFIISNRKTSN